MVGLRKRVGWGESSERRALAFNFRGEHTKSFSTNDSIQRSLHPTTYPASSRSSSCSFSMKDSVFPFLSVSMGTLTLHRKSSEVRES